MLESLIVVPILILIGFLIVAYVEGWGQIEKEEIIQEYSIEMRGKTIGLLYIIKRTYISGKIKIIKKKIYH